MCENDRGALWDWGSVEQVLGASSDYRSSSEDRHARLSMRRVALTIPILLVPVALVAGCGSSALKHEAQKLESARILSSTAPLSDRLIKRSEIESASDTAAVRTFLHLWSLLQFGSWDQAEQLFEPGLRNTIGASTLAQALELDLIVWQGTKPNIITAGVTHGEATISFFARNEQGSVIPSSISFGGAPNGWRVSYFSMLNPAIQRAVQLRVQAQLEPLGTKANAEAVRQGADAAALQGIYLEHRLGGAAKP